MSPLKNIALAGASGSLGTLVLEKVQEAGTFNITVLRRKGSPSTFPSTLKVVDVDYDSVDELTAALKGQDAVVSTVGTQQVAGQTVLIDAAIAAGVQRFIPSEFGSNLENPNARALPVFIYKVQVQDYIKKKAEETSLSYTFVHNNAFLDWGLQYDFILQHSDYKPKLYDGGDIVFSSTSLSSVADAVVGILNHPDETANRVVYIEDIKLTQNKLLELAKKVAPEKPWQPEVVKIDDIVARSDERLKQGLLDMETFAPYLVRAVLGKDYGGNFQKTDNELLGVKGKTEDDVVGYLKQYIK
jgi:uncharacterized protein YbjT (DUF2867 family)